MKMMQSSNGKTIIYNSKLRPQVTKQRILTLKKKKKAEEEEPEASQSNSYKLFLS